MSLKAAYNNNIVSFMLLFFFNVRSNAIIWRRNNNIGQSKADDIADADTSIKRNNRITITIVWPLVNVDYKLCLY